MTDFVRPNGTIFTAKDDVAAFQAKKAGYQPATPEDLQHAANVKEYSSPLSKVRVVGERLLAGIIPDFGLGDVALRKLAPEYMKGMEGRMDAAPELAYGAEGIGMGLGELLSAGLSSGSTASKLAAKGLSAGTRLVGKAGALGGEFVEKQLLKKVGEGAIGTAVSKGAGFAATHAVEGALYGLENAVSDAAIHDTEFTANAVLSHMGDGALFNVGLTAGVKGLAAGLKGINKGGQKIAQKLGSFATKEKVHSEAFLGLKPLTGQVSGLGETAEAVQKGVQDIGETMYKEGLTGTKSFEELQKKFEPLIKEAGEDIGKLRDEFDAGVSRPSADAIKEKLDQIYTQLESSAAKQDILKTAGKKFDDFYRKIAPVARDAEGKAIFSVVNGKRVYQREPTTFKNLWEQWHGFEDALAKPGADMRPDYEILQAIVKTAKEEFLVAGERAAQDIGANTLEKWRLANAKFSHLAEIRPLIKKRFAEEVNKTVGSAARRFVEKPWDTVKGAVGDRVIGSGPTAWSERLNKLSQLDEVAKVGWDFTDTIQRFADRVASGSKVATKVWDQKTLATPAPVAIQRIQEMQSNPEMLGAAAQRVAAPFAASAPALSTQIMSDFQRKVEYLAGLTPTDVSGISLIPRSPRYLQEDTKKFMDVYNAVWDPMGTINRMGAGRLSKAAIDAIRVTSPPIYAKLQEAVLAAVAKEGKKLSYNTRNIYTNMFGKPADQTRTPEFQSKLQASKAPKEKSPGRGGGGGGPVKTPQMYDSPSSILAQTR